MSGAGGGVLVLPFLVPVVGVKGIVPVMAIAMFIGNFSRVWVYRKDIRWDLLLRLSIAVAPGVFIGTYIYNWLPTRLVVLLIGVFLVVSSDRYARVSHRVDRGYGHDSRRLRGALDDQPHIGERARGHHRDHDNGGGYFFSLAFLDELDDTVKEIAQTISTNAPLSIVASRFAISEVVKDSAVRDIDAINEAVAACFDSADYKEGGTAFKEKRKP